MLMAHLIPTMRVVTPIPTQTRVVTIVCSVCFVGRAACVLLLALSSILKWSAMKDVRFGLASTCCCRNHVPIGGVIVLVRLN